MGLPHADRSRMNGMIISTTHAFSDNMKINKQVALISQRIYFSWKTTHLLRALKKKHTHSLSQKNTHTQLHSYNFITGKGSTVTTKCDSGAITPCICNTHTGRYLGRCSSVTSHLLGIRNHLSCLHPHSLLTLI